MHQEHLATDSNGFCFLPEGIEGPKTGGVDSMIPSDLSILAICKCRKLFSNLKNDWMLAFPGTEIFAPENRPYPQKERIVSQASIFRDYVRFSESSFSSTTIF